MQQERALTALVLGIAIAASACAATGMFSSQGPGNYQYQSIRGQNVTIHGTGAYQHMSAEVAIQGIAQDIVTLLVGVPLLLASFFFARRGYLKWRFVLAGALGYFLVTYLFYLVMAMYNQLFLAYAFLMGASFFALCLTVLSFDIKNLPASFKEKAPVGLSGGFLVFSAVIIALLWLSVVVPPLLDGSIYPAAVAHYTTLIVQGMDLGLLLPLAALSGVLLRQKKPFGYLLGPSFLVFLSLLMTALLAKVIAMGMKGHGIIPVIVIVPPFMGAAVACSWLLLRNVKSGK